MVMITFIPFVLNLVMVILNLLNQLGILFLLAFLILLGRSLLSVALSLMSKIKVAINCT